MKSYDLDEFGKLVGFLKFKREQSRGKFTFEEKISDYQHRVLRIILHIDSYLIPFMINFEGDKEVTITAYSKNGHVYETIDAVWVIYDIIPFLTELGITVKIARKIEWEIIKP